MGGPESAGAEIRSQIEGIEANRSLFDKADFQGRAAAIDQIEFHIIDRLRFELQGRSQTHDLRALHQRAVALRQRLEDLNERLFQRLRQEITSGTCSGESLRRELGRYVEPSPGTSAQFGPRYDTLDVFVNGLLSIDAPPAETMERDPEMVFYQPTPARFILEMIERAGILRDDVFYDLGAGLGQVPILVALLTGARAIGVELQPAYYQYAQQCAKRLSVANVHFVNLDVRETSFADGTVFYLYTPFLGKMLHQVLERLQREGQQRAIRVCTYGPCTHDVSDQSWLRRVDSGAICDHRLAVFKSV